MSTSDTPTQPTPEERQQAESVAAAGAQAAAQGDDAGRAMRDERDRVGLKMSDEDIEKVAQKLNELNIAEFAKRGAFDPPPEPVRPPPQSTAPAAPGEAPPGEETPAQSPQQPQKRTPAQKFMGLS